LPALAAGRKIGALRSLATHAERAELRQTGSPSRAFEGSLDGSMALLPPARADPGRATARRAAHRGPGSRSLSIRADAKWPGSLAKDWVFADPGTITPVTAATEPLRAVRLGPAQAEAAFALSAEAGWNQTIDDWRLMLGEGEATGQITAAGQLVASGLILPYGERLAWIAMILTSEPLRGRGLATRNLQWALERCRQRRLVAGLDATLAGVEVYRPLGFDEVCGLQRMVAEPPRSLRSLHREVAIRPVQAARDLDAIARLDTKVFGAERRGLLAHLSRSQPHRALLAEAQGELAGFVLCRTGRATLHLGPLVARSANIASLLLAQALVGVSGPVSIDVPVAHASFAETLGRAGFQPVRSFTRMLQGAPDRRGDLAACFAICGPEFG
jgi:GNAT superfamily N-acetyltransferase